MTPYVHERPGGCRVRGVWRQPSVWAAVLVSGAAVGCAGSAPGATMAQLQSRAVYDLGCSAGQIAVYHLDARTKAAVGCGRRLLYVESCQRIRDEHACTWVLDTPTFAQAQWPQLYAAPPPATYVVLPAAAGSGRSVATSLFDARATTGTAGSGAPLGPPAPKAPPAQGGPPAQQVPTAGPSTSTVPPGADGGAPTSPPGDDERGRIISTELFTPSSSGEGL